MQRSHLLRNGAHPGGTPAAVPARAPRSVPVSPIAPACPLAQLLDAGVPPPPLQSRAGQLRSPALAGAARHDTPLAHATTAHHRAGRHGARLARRPVLDRALHAEPQLIAMASAYEQATVHQRTPALPSSITEVLRRT